VHTGDGIQRVSEAEALLTPRGGEGGSVPQALGSKAERRAKRRKQKKDSYAEYLESSTWRAIRARALKRDKNKCRACGEKAEHVHHIRYPKNLGDEKMEWLYSLCVPCHNAIHRAARVMPLRKATELILASPTDTSNVIYLPDDWRLSKTAARKRATGRWAEKNPRDKKKRKKPKKLKPFEIKAGGPRISARGSRRTSIQAANDELHQIQQRARESRERRRNA